MSKPQKALYIPVDDETKLNWELSLAETQVKEKQKLTNAEFLKILLEKYILYLRQDVNDSK